MEDKKQLRGTVFEWKAVKRLGRKSPSADRVRAANQQDCKRSPARRRIAHDLLILMTVILGHTEFLERNEPAKIEERASPRFGKAAERWRVALLIRFSRIAESVLEPDGSCNSTRFLEDMDDIYDECR